MTERTVAILVNTLHSGGAEKQSVFLLNALQERYKTVFVVLHGGRVEQKLLRLIDPGNHVLVELEGRFWRKIICFYRLLKKEQVSHLFTYLTKPNFLGALVGRLAGVRRIYGSIRTSRLPAWKLWLEWFASACLCTNTIFNSFEGERLLRGNGLRRTLVIPNCLQPVFAPMERVDPLMKKIVSVGRFVPEKDYATALRAVSVLARAGDVFVYQIVGYGSGEREIRKMVEDLGLEDVVQIFVDPEDVQTLLQDSDIYLSTSVIEGTSNAILEAMNASLPVVATRVGDNEKLIREGKNGYLHSVGDHFGIARSLATLLGSYESRVMLGLESNRIIREDYGFECFKRSYWGLIETV